MKTLRRLIYGEVLVAVGFVTLGFLGLFFFFDFVDELQGIGKNNGAERAKPSKTLPKPSLPQKACEGFSAAIAWGARPPTAPIRCLRRACTSSKRAAAVP